MDDRRDSRDERPGDGAFFVTAPVRPGRRSPVALAALMLVVAGLAGAAVLGSTLPGAGRPAANAIASSPADPSEAGPQVTAMPIAPAIDLAQGDTDPLLGLETHTSGRLVLIHGDVFAIDVVVVIVSLVDTADRLIGIQSVDIPGGSTALRIGANDRFDLAFRLVDARSPAWVEANAYDQFGRRIATARSPVQVPFEPVRSRFGAGS